MSAACQHHTLDCTARTSCFSWCINRLSINACEADILASSARSSQSDVKQMCTVFESSADSENF